jgi:hypothetical protein
MDIGTEKDQIKLHLHKHLGTMLDFEIKEHLGTVCALSFFNGPVLQVEELQGSCLIYAAELTRSI